LETGNTVLVETNGTQDISVLPRATIRIMDVKCPSSGMSGFFMDSNIESLRSTDQSKFVISDRADFEWARDFVSAHTLSDRCVTIFSPNMQKCPPRVLAEWILAEKVPVRLGLQLHKFIWGENVQGV
jgi:7-carboxy-7-deazaguanine synthase